MRLWTFKAKTEESVKFADMGLRSWRGVLSGSLWPLSLFYGMELKCDGAPDGRFKEWTEVPSSYWAVRLGWWEWGEEHFWYDGPHCSYSWGFIHAAWSWGWCAKCRDGR